LRRFAEEKSKPTRSKGLRMRTTEGLPGSGKPFLHRAKQFSQKGNGGGGASAFDRRIPARIAHCKACPFDWIFPRWQSRCATGCCTSLARRSFSAHRFVARSCRPWHSDGQPTRLGRRANRSTPKTRCAMWMSNSMRPPPISPIVLSRIFPTRHFDSHPRFRLVDKKFAVAMASLRVTDELKKEHSWLPGDRQIRRFWFTYPAVMGTIHVERNPRHPYASCNWMFRSGMRNAAVDRLCS
jgi:hypothetical protein